MTTPTVKISTPPEFMEDSPYAEQPLGAEGYWGGGVDNSSAAKREYMPVVCEQTWDDLGLFIERVELVEKFCGFVDRLRFGLELPTSEEEVGVGVRKYRGLSNSRLYPAILKNTGEQASS